MFTLFVFSFEKHLNPNPLIANTLRRQGLPPNEPIAVKTIAAKPAAGPLTPIFESDNPPTTIPPIIPAINPEKRGAPLANAIPKHKGNATKNTTILAGKSFLIYLNIYITLYL